MDAFQSLSSLSCELRIIRAKNLDFKSAGHLFVRCYLSAGNNTRVQLNSQEISLKSDLFWNESFSLDCFGTKDSMDMLLQGSVVLELRWRNKVPILGRIGGSHLLGRAEIPWRSVLESHSNKIDKWIVMRSKSGGMDKGVKPPAVQIGMKIGVPNMAKTIRRRNGRLMKWDECGCMDGGCKSCADYDIFALGACLEAL